MKMNEARHIMKIVTQDGKKLESLNPEKIYIVLNPYAYNPEESFSRAVRIVHWLRTTHKVAVFSPILHTHPYHIACLKTDPNHNDDYYDWDLKVYDAMREKSVMIFTLDYKKSKGCSLEMNWGTEHNIPIYFINEGK